MTQEEVTPNMPWMTSREIQYSVHRIIRIALDPSCSFLFFNTSHVGHLKQPFSSRRFYYWFGLPFPNFNRPWKKSKRPYISPDIFTRSRLFSSLVAHSPAVCSQLPQLISSPLTSLLFSNSKLPAQYFRLSYITPEVTRPYCITPPRFRGIYPHVGISSSRLDPYLTPGRCMTRLSGRKISTYDFPFKVR